MLHEHNKEWDHLHFAGGNVHPPLVDSLAAFDVTKHVVIMRPRC